MLKLCIYLSILFSFLLLTASTGYAADYKGPGLVKAPLITQTQDVVGIANVWNTRDEFRVRLIPGENWELKKIKIYVGNDPVPATRKGNLIPGRFNYKDRCEFTDNGDCWLRLSLETDLGITWGLSSAEQRLQNVAVHLTADKIDPAGNPGESQAAWAYTGLGVATRTGEIDEETLTDFEGVGRGWLFTYNTGHPRGGHFIDSPVAGLTAESPTYSGVTTESGAFDFFPGETVTFAIGKHIIGSTVAAQKVSPLDLFEMGDSESTEVINMARLLQSLDEDAYPKSGIMISPTVLTAFESAMTQLGLDSLDFTNSQQIEDIIDTTIDTGNTLGLSLAAVSATDAKDHLEETLNASMFRKNVSKTPVLASSKAKMNVMGLWMPALKANAALDPASNEPPTPVTIEYFDENGDLIRQTDQAKPLIITYTDADAETGAHDVWSAISRDDGATWKRKNISRMAYRSSFILENGNEYFGHCKKPVFQVKGNKILISWTSKYARGGKPRYAIDTQDDYTFDDPYWKDDIWGVSGPQLSVDYTDQGYPEVGEVPYSAVWVARGIIATPADVSKGIGDFEGDIVWFKPERLTSARRDANQIFLAAADGAGFALTWQEDPGGLRPGEAKGPGPGWGGATTNHKTDIWYSYITWANFAKVDTNFLSGGDPEHDDPDFVGRPKALVPLSLPVRVSDNDAVNTENMLVELDSNGLPVQDANNNFIPIINPDATSEDADGSHRYGYLQPGLWNWDGSSIYYENGIADNWVEGSGTLYQFINQQNEVKTVVVTADGRALDGNTGASRPNLFLQTYTKPDGSKSAWAIMAYEETKGVGLGPDEDAGTTDSEGAEDGSGYDPYEIFPDEGKNAIYHSFEFQDPDLVSAGMVLNFPETDEFGEPLYVVEPEYLGSTLNADGTYEPIPNPLAGTQITDWKGDPIYAYENARRPRFILQSKAAAFGGTKPDGSFKESGNSGTVLIVLYKEGEDGAGRPSDIMARRCVVKDPAGTILGGNPWAPKNFIPHNTDDGRIAVQNVSTVMPGTTWINPERDEDAKGDGIKVCDWTQPEECLSWKSSVNPNEDARAHRGQIRGDFVIMGYSYTPNWAASRNAHDKYDFYIRRSFNGGATWTTDPAADSDVVHTDIFIDPEGISGAELTESGEDASEASKHYEVYTSYAGGGIYEPARNVSLIPNNKVSVIEPRIVAVPGTIKDPATKEWTGISEDKQNRSVFYLAYGTSTNLPDIEKAPEDLFYSFSMNKGTTLIEEEWDINPDSEGPIAGETVTRWDYLAKGDPEQGEVQLRMTPDGTRFYSCWLQEIEIADPENPTHFEGSDIWFRRIMPFEFEVNQGTPTEP